MGPAEKKFFFRENVPERSVKGGDAQRRSMVPRGRSSLNERKQGDRPHVHEPENESHPAAVRRSDPDRRPQEARANTFFLSSRWRGRQEGRRHRSPARTQRRREQRSDERAPRRGSTTGPAAPRTP